MFLCFLIQPLLAQRSNVDIQGIGIGNGTGGLEYWGPCPVMMHYRATIYATKPQLQFEYFWLRSDGSTTPVVRATFANGETKLNVSDDWTAGEPAKQFSTWDELHVNTAHGNVISERASQAGMCRHRGENREGCSIAAASLLKSPVKILKLVNQRDLGIAERTYQCLAVVPLGQSKTSNDSLPIRRGVMLEFRDGRWSKVLDISRNIRNGAGYIGIDYLDTGTNYGYSLSLSDKRSDNVRQFTLFLTHLNDKRQIEGIPIEISWNAALGRYQEFAPNELDPPGYKLEIANPPVKPTQQ